MTTFRVTYRVKGIHLPPDSDPVRFQYLAEDGPVTVELVASHDAPSVMCQVWTDIAVSDEIRRGLEMLADRRLPGGGPDRDSPFIKDNTGEEGRFAAEFTLPIRFLPEALATWLASLEDTLEDYAERTASVLRWQFGMPGRSRPLSEARYEFSENGTDWKPLPYEIPRPERALIVSGYDPQARDAIEHYVASGGREPLAHEMYREAVANRIDNPRSCLAVVVAAAEVGIKQTAAAAAPAAGWLLERGPSPSAIDLLTGYLPTLPIQKYRGVFVSPTKRIKRDLGDAVKARNELVHAGVFALTDDRLTEILDSVRDLIWLLDFYGGQVWALNHLSASTQHELLTATGAQSLPDLEGV